MKITQIQIRLVRRSFSLASTRAPQIAGLFFDRLFELDPQIRQLFQDVDMERHGKKVMRMLALIISTLDDEAALDPAMQAMGKRHAKYGVRAEHYETFCEALLWALERGLDKQFTPAMHEAWRTTLEIITEKANDNIYGALA